MALHVPTAGECWQVAGPIVALGGLIWLARNGSWAVDRLFPHLEWERKMGWLNARADHRANRIMRALQHLLHLFLLADLGGVLAFAWLIGHRDTETRIGLLFLAGDFVYMGVFLSPWIYYFIAVLGPRLQAEFEEQELARFREENPDIQEEMKQTRSAPISIWESSRPRRF